MRNRSLVASALALIGLTAGLLIYPSLMQRAKGGPSKIEMPETRSFRILLGLGDTEPAVWDGSIKVSTGKIVSIQGWRFAENDSSDYKSSWKASTRRGMAVPAQRRAGVEPPVFENGVIIGAAIPDATARFDVQTPQGAFSFAAQEIPMGESKLFLAGKVAVDQVPSAVQLTTSGEDEDFPAVAQSDDDLYVTYVQFVHGDRRQAVVGQFREEPASFDFLARPVGGDQVMLLHYSKSANVWGPAVPVSAAGQDIARATVAIDGKKRVWVIWAANQNGNFDLYAKSYDAGKWSPEIRLTKDGGTDLNPVAATDSSGRVWVAWQAFRNNNLEILAAVQRGDTFSAETPVSFSPMSDWDPAIATAANGEVAVSWDTYDKGDYDVYFRRLRAGPDMQREIQMDAPIPVAASQNFEARSSIAYDKQNRLWVAYEASDIKWGKDFGAYETTGIALYQGHNLHVKCFDGAKAFTTAEDVSEALPGPPQAMQRRGRRTRIADEVPTPRPANLNQPNPQLAANRRPSSTPQPPPLPLNSFPRLTVDSAGTVYLAFRAVGGAWRSPVGAVWFENIVYYDGAKWNGPTFVPRTDGLLDIRPALAALSPGRLLIVSSMDHRQSQVPGGGRRGGEGINSDIYAADLRIDGGAVAARLKPYTCRSCRGPGTIRQARTGAGGGHAQLSRHAGPGEASLAARRVSSPYRDFR